MNANREEKPLQSWKEIAAYLERDERTAMRWEKEDGLPVRRLRAGGKAGVYAYPSEIEAWRSRRGPATPAKAKKWLPVAAVAAGLAAAVWFIDRGPIMNPPSPRAEAAGVVGMTERLVSGNSLAFRGSPFPDGRRISCVNWVDNGALAICDLESGEIVSLTKHSTEKTEFTYYSVVSPDGGKIAYTALFDGLWELRIVDVDAEQPYKTARTLHRSENTHYIDPFAVTPDLQHVLALFSLSGEARLVFVSVEDGTLTQLKSLAWRWPEHVSVSADGRWIAYDSAVSRGSQDRDIFLLSADGSREAQIVRRKGLDTRPIFAPNGDLLFVSDRSGDLGLWRLPMDGAEAAGAPELVKAPTGMIAPVGFTPSGSLFYGVQRESEDVFMVDLGPGTGRMLSRPVHATDQFLGRNFYPSWAPDGERLAYVSRGEAHGVGGGVSASILAIRSMSTGENLEHQTEFQRIRPFRWFPDGTSLIVPATTKGQRAWSLYKIDARSGEAKRLTPSLSRTFRFARPAVSPDGGTVYYIGTDPPGQTDSARPQLVALDVESRVERTVYSPSAPEVIASVAVSPDGKTLALVTATPGSRAKGTDMAVGVMPAKGGKLTTIFEAQGADYTAAYDNGIEWTPDGEYVLASIPSNIYPGPRTGKLCGSLSMAASRQVSAARSCGKTSCGFRPCIPTEKRWRSTPAARASWGVSFGFWKAFSQSLHRTTNRDQPCGSAS